MSESPFVPGTRVAVDIGYRGEPEYREGLVDKVYKTGRFTLKDNDQQWRPSSPSHYQPHWTARKTGRHLYSSNNDRLLIWDDQTDAEIRETTAKNNRRARFNAARKNITDKLHWYENMTEQQVAEMEAFAASLLLNNRKSET